MTPTTTPRRTPFLAQPGFWRNLTLGASIVLTAMTGLVVGWFAIYFQFGDTADADDYAMAAGAYGAGAVLLLLGTVAAWGWQAPRWQLFLALGSAGLLAFLTMSAMAQISSAEPGYGSSSWLDGAGGVAACPWTWPLVLLGLWRIATLPRLGGDSSAARR